MTDSLLRSVYGNRAALPPSPQEIEAADAAAEAVGGEFGRAYKAGLRGTLGSMGEFATGTARYFGAGNDYATEYSDRQRARVANLAPAVPTFDDVSDLRSAGMYAASKTGQALGSTVPTIGGAIVARNPYVGAFLGAFPAEAGETLGHVRNDPEYQNIDPDTAYHTALAKGAVGGVMESIVPGGFGRATKGALAGSPFVTRVLSDAVKEGVTEMGQESVGQDALTFLNPNRDKSGDAKDIREAGIGGFLGGGGMSLPGATIDKLSSEAQKAGSKGKQGYEQAFEGAEDVARRLQGSAKDLFSTVFSRSASERGEVFRKTEEDLATGDVESTIANLMKNDRERSESTALMAKEFGMEGDANDPSFQEKVSSAFNAKSAGEFFAKSSKALNKAAAAARGIARGKLDEFTKKSEMQELSPDLEATVFSHLSQEAAENEEIRTRIPRITASLRDLVISADSLSGKELRGIISQLKETTGMFNDPVALLQDLGSRLGSKQNLFEQAEKFSSAERDAGNEESFLHRSLKPGINASSAQLKKVGRFLDEYATLNLSKEQNATIIKKLSDEVFGTESNTRAVLNFYAKQNREKLNLDMVGEQTQELDEIDTEAASEQQGLQEKSAPRVSYVYKEAANKRAFKATGREDYRAIHKQAQAIRDRSAGSANVRFKTLSELYDGSSVEAKKGYARKLYDDVAGRYKKEIERNGMDTPLAKKLRLEVEDLRTVANATEDQFFGKRNVGKGVEGILKSYGVFEVSEQDPNDLKATDDELNSMRVLINAKVRDKGQTITFERTQGNPISLHPESMWKTQAKKPGNADKGKRQLFQEALASVLAREDIKGLKLPAGVSQDAFLQELNIDRRSDETAARAPKPAQAPLELNKLKDNVLSRIDAATEEFENAQDAQERAESLEDLERVEAWLSTKLEASRAKDKEKTNRFGRTQEINEALKEVRSALENMKAESYVLSNEDQDYLNMLQGRSEKEGARYYEADTGLKVGAEKRNRPAKPEPKNKRLSAEVAKKLSALATDTLGAGVKIAVRQIDTFGDYFLLGEHSFSQIDNKMQIKLYELAHDIFKGTPEKTLHHEMAHAVVSMLYANYKPEQAAAIIGLANTPYIKSKIRELAPETAEHTTAHPEEIFAEAYGLWATGKLKLSGGKQDATRTIFEMIADFFKKLVRDEDLLVDLFASIKEGGFKGTLPHPLNNKVITERVKDSRFFTQEKQEDDEPDIMFSKMEEGWTAEQEEKLNAAQKAASEAARAAKTSEEVEAAGKLADAAEDLLDQKKAATAKKSSMEEIPEGPGLTEKEKAEVTAYVHKVLGPKVDVEFYKQFGLPGFGGSYSYDAKRGKRLIQIAARTQAFAMSMAYHESMHDFFTMLLVDPRTRNIANTLLTAADSPAVRNQLERLLKDQPAALKQITDEKSAPEERLSYMYQFWAGGQLTLGTETKNAFGKIVKFFRKVMGLLSKEEKAQKILTAFHEGKFQDVSVAGEVMNEIGANTFYDRLKDHAKPISTAANKLFSSATDRLRSTDIPAFSELADLFHQDPGHEKGGLGFLQKRAQQSGVLLNKLQKILKDTTVSERRTLLKQMQNMEDVTSPKAIELRAFLNDVHKYMVDAGVKNVYAQEKAKDLGYVQKYFPRVWDYATIQANKQEFAQLLSDEGSMSTEAINEFLRTVAENPDGADISGGRATNKPAYTPYAPQVRSRVFTFINESNAAKFSKFQQNNMIDVMSAYIFQATHRAEFARSFGNNGETIAALIDQAKTQGATTEQVNTAVNAVAAMEGTLGNDFNPQLRNLMAGAITYENFVLLPFALVSSLIDPLGYWVRTGDFSEAYKAFGEGLKGLGQAIKGTEDQDEGKQLAQMLGIIDEHNMLESMGHVYQSMYMNKSLKQFNTAFFRWNGMELWTRRLRIAGIWTGMRFIAKNVDNEQYMNELGLQKGDVQIIHDVERGVRIALTQAEGLTPEQEQRVQEAMFKFVDSAILRPNAAHRPIWGSDPRYMLLFHLKQFTYSFHNVIIKRVQAEVKNGKAWPVWALISYVPFMFAFDMLKGSLLGTLNTSWTALDYLTNAIDRSGILGVGGFGLQALEDVGHGRLPGSSLVGPTVDHALTGAKTLLGAPGATVSEFLVRSLPGSPLFKAIAT